MDTDRLNKLGVILPTLNCRDRLKFHLDRCLPWIRGAGQTVAVDSYSTDGTWELLQEALLPLGAKLIQRPKGLYEAWNTGIEEIDKPWLYVSTVGDTISKEGLLELLSLGEQQSADLVISPPLIVDEEDRPVPDVRSPMEEILVISPPNESLLADSVLFFYWTAWYALVGGMNTPLGSSAGNIFSTKILKQWNFPCEYGSAGDAFWCIQHAPSLRVAVTAKKVSHFMIHPREHSKQSSEQLHLWMDQAHIILKKHYLGMKTEGKITHEGQTVWEWIENYYRQSDAWNERCISSVPWVISPKAWILKLRLKQLKRQRHNIAMQLSRMANC